MSVFQGVLYVFLCSSTPLDNNGWYARVGIFNSRTQYTSPNVRYYYDVNFFANLLNKTKNSIEVLPNLSHFLFWCNGVTVLFLYIYILLVIILYQKLFYFYTFDKEFFLTFQNISMNNFSLNF